MDRLDQIVHAEERAAKAVEAAREQARTLMSEAKTESDLIRETARRKAHEAADAHVREVLLATEKEVQEAVHRSAADMRAEVGDAEKRLQDAVKVVVEELAG